MAPSITEVVFTLGQGDRVAGVSEFCEYPPEAKKKPFCGGWMNPNLEVISKLKPDLVILQGEHQKVREFCERRGIPFLAVDMDSLGTTRKGIEAIGRRLGCTEEGSALISRMEKEFEEVRKKVANRLRPKVFVALGHKQGSLSGIYTSGGGGFLSEILELAGGEDIFKDIGSAYPKPSLESLVKRSPDIILEMHPGEELSEEDWQQLLKDWEAIPSLPAVKNGRIERISESYTLLPGPRLTILARKLAGIFHPEAGIEKG